MAASDPAILRKTVSRLYDAFREAVDSIGHIARIDVSVRQHQTMSLVCRLTEDKPNGVTLKELAEAMKLAPATVSELVESLVRKNFLQRVQNPEDRRAVRSPSRNTARPSSTNAPSASTPCAPICSTASPPPNATPC